LAVALAVDRNRCDHLTVDFHEELTRDFH
jgi:hypothetical protein